MRGVHLAAMTVALLTLSITAPRVMADMTLEKDGASLVVQTGAREKCVPTPDACVVEWHNREDVTESTLRAEGSVGVRAVVPAPLDEVPVSGLVPREAHVNGSDLNAPIPVTTWLDVWHARVVAPLLPDDFLVYVDPEPEELRWRDPVQDEAATSWGIANGSHVFVRPQLKTVDDTDTYAYSYAGPTHYCDLHQHIIRRYVNGTPGACPLASSMSAGVRAYENLTPNVVHGAYYNDTHTNFGAEGATLSQAGSLRADRALLSGAGAVTLPPHARLNAAFQPAHPRLSAPAPPDASARERVGVAGATDAWGSVRPASALALDRDVLHDARVTAAAAAGVAAIALVAWALLYRHRVRGEGASVLLKHSTRRAIHDAAQAEPGLTVAELARRVGVSHNNALYHARLLEHARVVRFVRDEGPRAFVHVYPERQAPARDREAHALLLRAPHARSIARVLVRAGARGVSVKDVTRATGLPVVTVRFHLKAFERGALVDVTDAPRTHLLYRMREEEREFVRDTLREAEWDHVASRHGREAAPRIASDQDA